MALAQDIAVLESVPLFRQLDRDALRLIAFAAEARSGQPGELLFIRGEVSDAGYVVMSGSVVVEGAAGDRIIASRGTLIGEMALLIDTERPVTATVKEAGQLLKISRGVFRRVLEEYPEAADALRGDPQDIQNFNVDRGDLVLEPVYDRSINETRQWHGNDQEENWKREKANAFPSVNVVNIRGRHRVDRPAQTHHQGGHHPVSGVVDLHEKEHSTAR